ncbi:MAG: hypothetical protein ACFE0O_06020 [Opitutales bacterium]
MIVAHPLRFLSACLLFPLALVAAPEADPPDAESGEGPVPARQPAHSDADDGEKAPAGARDADDDEAEAGGPRDPEADEEEKAPAGARDADADGEEASPSPRGGDADDEEKPAPSDPEADREEEASDQRDVEADEREGEKAASPAPEDETGEG